jgi:hypothetical protein
VTNQPNFLVSSSEVTAPRDWPAAQKPNLIVTNRSNLVDFLSSGLLRPKDAMLKYYEDTLALTPGAIPVIAAPAPDALIELCEREAGNFAVLIEVDADLVLQTAEPGIGCLEVETLDVANAVHLRGEDQLSELTARRFDNADFARLRYRVSPDMFGGERPSAEAVTAAVAAVASGWPTRDFATSGRLGGARLLALRAAPRTRAGLEQIVHIAFGSALSQPRGQPKGPADWIRLGPKLGEYRPAKSAGYDERVFLAAAAICIARDHRDAWDGLGVLKQVDALLSEDDSLSAKDRSRWQAASARMRAYLMAAKPFTGFDKAGYSSDKALLLALIRGSIEDVLSWHEENVGADPWDLVVAATLIGLVHGRSVSPLSIRPVGVDRLLARLERDEILGRPPDNGSLEITTVDADGGRELLLRVGGDAVLRVPQAPPTSVEVLDELDLGASAVQDQLVQIARARGWQDAIRTSLSFQASFEHTVAEGGSRIVIHGDVTVQPRIEADVFRAKVASDTSSELSRLLAAVSGEPVRGSEER